jgi:hypothetical protein
MTNTGW